MYAKLFGSILSSSIWSEDSDTCKVWVTLLAMQDREGFVFGSVSGLARVTALPRDKVQAVIEKFLGPDPDSSDLTRVPEREGRRIEVIEGGWKLLNANFYRELRDDEERRLKDRERQAKHREKKAREAGESVTVGNAESQPVTACHGHGLSRSVTPSESESEVEVDTEKNSQEREGRPPRSGARKPKNRAEVVTHFSEHGLKGDPDAFFDWHEGHGWKWKLWRSAAANWSRREARSGNRAGPARIENSAEVQAGKAPGDGGAHVNQRVNDKPVEDWTDEEAEAYLREFPEHREKVAAARRKSA